PCLEVEVGWRSRGQDDGIGRDADTRCVPGVERPVVVEVADVVSRVTGCGEAFESENAISDDVDVALGDGLELSPERLERVAVQAACAGLETAWVDEVWRADLRHVHLQVRMPPHEGPRRAGVIEMDVREQDVADIAERRSAFTQSALEVSEARSRAAVEEGGAVLRLQEVRADDALDALMVQVDRS